MYWAWVRGGLVAGGTVLTGGGYVGIGAGSELVL